MDVLGIVAAGLMAKATAAGVLGPSVRTGQATTSVNGTVGLIVFTKAEMKGAGASGPYRKAHAVISLSGFGDVTGAFLKGGSPVVLCTFDGYIDPITECVELYGCGAVASSC